MCHHKNWWSAMDGAMEPVNLQHCSMQLSVTTPDRKKMWDVHEGR